MPGAGGGADDAHTEAVLAEGMAWLRERYAGVLAEGPPTDPVYVEALRGGLLLLLEMRLPGVPDPIEAWIRQAAPAELLGFVASLLEEGGLYRQCRQILDAAAAAPPGDPGRE